MPDATAAILIIGDEILSGKTRDENAQFLIGELRELGVSLRRILVIPDRLEAIEGAVRELSATYTHVFTSGGVGPTHDDLTMAGVARAFDTEVVRHPELEAILRGYYGEKLEERNLRMADVPARATLHRAEGLAWPVIALENVYVLPGIPAIFKKKFLAIRERFRQQPFHLTCIYTRDEEGRIAAHLDRVAEQFSDVSIGSYPQIVPHPEGGWRVKLTLESKERARVAAAADALCTLLDPASIVKVDSAQ